MAKRGRPKRSVTSSRPVGDSLPAGVEGDPQGLEEIRETNESTEELSFQDKLHGWVAREQYDLTSAQCHLYRFDHPTSGEDKALCAKWSNQIPDPHDVGLIYGSGRYLLLVTLPKTDKGIRPIKGYRFRLHPRYDDLAERAKAAGTVPNLGGVTGGSVTGFQPPATAPGPVADPLKYMAEVIKLISPLITVRPQAADPSAMISETYKTMSGIMRQNLLDTQEMIGEVQRRRLTESGVADFDEGEDEEEPGIVEQIAPLLEKYVPMLLGRGVASAAVRETVKGLPVFKKLVRDNRELSRVIAFLDKSQGNDKTDAVLKALKINRPK